MEGASSVSRQGGAWEATGRKRKGEAYIWERRAVSKTKPEEREGRHEGPGRSEVSAASVPKPLKGRGPSIVPWASTIISRAFQWSTHLDFAG